MPTGAAEGTALTMATVLSAITEVFTAAVGWVGTVSDGEGARQAKRAPLLPGGVAVAVVNHKLPAAVDGLGRLLVLQKLRPVVCSDSFESFPEIRLGALQRVKDFPD